MSIFNISYQPIRKDSIEDEIERSFAPDIDELEQLGFELEVYYREIVSTAITLIMSPFILLMRHQGSIVRFERPLRACIYNPLVIHYATGTYTDITAGKYMRFLTPCTNGNMVVTSNAIGSGNAPNKGYYREDHETLKTPELWQRHQKRLRQYQKDGWEPELPANFKTFSRVLKYENSVFFGKIIT